MRGTGEICRWLERTLPEPAVRKVKLVRMVLKNDYHFANYIASFPEAVTAEELQALRRGLDEESRQNIRRFLELNHYSRENFSAVFPFVDRRAIQVAAAARVTAQKNALRKLRRRYHFLDPVQLNECALVHGLAEATPAELAYVEHSDFIDAGAFSGESAILMMDFAPRCVYSFDPACGAEEKYERNLRRAKIAPERRRFFNLALGDANEDINFSASDGSAAGCDAASGWTVTAVRLDDFLASHPEIQPRFIKADIEGMGWRMFMGMRAAIRRFRPILSLAIYHNKAEFLKIKAELETPDWNYRIRIVAMSPCNAVYELYLYATPAELDASSCV